ncbi:MAG TPA: META domain-containing protein [Gemmatimonadaceae bacterium]|nr:META domain-containing protein [Gemmatimonadaceae bacterium]
MTACRSTYTPLLLMLAACTAASRTESDSGAAAQGRGAALDSTEWVLASLGGAPAVAGSRVTLRFADESAGGYGGCNWYGGGYTASGASIHFASVESTARACLLPDGVGEQEARFYGALRRAASYRVAGDRLEMADSSGASIVALTRRVPAPMRPQDLVGTSWQLRSVGDTAQSAAAGPPLTLHFSPTGIDGFAGCRRYTGTYEARGDEVRITSLAMASTECGAGDAALQREGRFTTDLSEASNYRLSGDSLEWLTAPGRRLVFVRQPPTR